MDDPFKKQTDTVTWHALSDATFEECEALIGKTVKSVEAFEYAFTVTFTDGTVLETTGARYGGCAMGVIVEQRGDTGGA